MKNPIKFLNPYTKEDKDIFFGRNEETEKIYEKSRAAKLLLIYGLSGTGKTSIVQCGLANRYADDEWFPLYVRRGNNFIKSLRNAIISKADTLISTNAPIIEALNSLYIDYFLPITIILDQFEELFISSKDEEYDEFINFLSEISKSTLNVKIILILREEYLACIDDFEAVVPNIYDHRIRLERMRKNVLFNVISNIIEKGDIYVEKKEYIVNKIISNLSDEKGNVDLPYLQVYLDRLMSNATKKDGICIFDGLLLERIGELKDVLGRFLEEQVKVIEKNIGEKGTVWAVLKNLITSEGTRASATLQELREKTNLLRMQLMKILNLLEEFRIIQLNDDNYELTHDSLAAKVAAHRTAKEKAAAEAFLVIQSSYKAHRTTNSFMTKEEILFITPHLADLSVSVEQKLFIEKSQRHIRNKKIFIICLAVFILILFSIPTFYGYKQWFQRRTLQIQFSNELEKHTQELNIRERNLREKRDSLYIKDQLLMESKNQIEMILKELEQENQKSKEYKRMISNLSTIKLPSEESLTLFVGIKKLYKDKSARILRITKNNNVAITDNDARLLRGEFEILATQEGYFPVEMEILNVYSGTKNTKTIVFKAEKISVKPKLFVNGEFYNQETISLANLQRAKLELEFAKDYPREIFANVKNVVKSFRIEASTSSNFVVCEETNIFNFCKCITKRGNSGNIKVVIRSIQLEDNNLRLEPTILKFNVTN